ncbi:MAG: sel1 repeat family protein [Myxococcales bacterium]|nr:sel1 repeat family protein [Myxococcales bacterium]
MFVKPRFALILLVGLAAAGCKSPSEKYEACAAKCSSFKTDLVRDVCEGSCARTAYGDLDVDKLRGLCEKGDSRACLRFASRAPKGEVASVLEARCNANDKMCCGLLGRMLKDGKILAKNKTKGYALMEKACKMGAPNFCASPALGYMTKREYDRAAPLATTGCNGGAKWSCGLLGVMYRDGKGVSRDRGKAKLYLGKACRKGLQMSCKALRRL